MIKKVNTFQTADGKLFESMADALPHDAAVTIRGLMNQKGIGAGGSTVTTIEAARFIVDNAEAMRDYLNKFLASKRRHTGTAGKV